MKGQTSMIAIVLSVVLLVFLLLFLLATTMPSPNAELKAEYRKLYATNLLLTMLNTQTVDCGSFSDMLKASYFGNGKCQDEEFGNRIEGYMQRMLLLSGHPEYDWQIVASPKSFNGPEDSWGSEGVTETKGYWDARTMLTSGNLMLEVKIYMRSR